RADLGEERRQLLAALAVTRERVLRAEAAQLLALELRDGLAARDRLRHRLAVHRGELRFVVEEREVRRAAGLVEGEQVLGARGAVQRLHAACAVVRRSEPARVEERQQRDRAQTGSTPAEERTARQSLAHRLEVVGHEL